jgi:pimeloyl-ACP methyl ester carboxylesterase
MAATPPQLAALAVERSQRLEVSLESGLTRYWSYSATNAPETAQTILFVHGYRGNHHGLEAIAGALPDFNILIPDLPGFGESEALPGTHNIDGYTTWLLQFVNALQLADALVLGHSFGTIVASSAGAQTLRNPLILVNPIASFGFGGIKAILAGVQNLFYWIGANLPDASGNALLKAPAMVRVMSEVLAKTKDKNLRAWIHQQHRDNFSVYANRNVALEGIKAGAETSVVEFAPKLTQPVLLIAGDMDDITSVKEQKRSVSFFPNAKLEILESVGHLTHYETPDEVAVLVRDFSRAI